MDISEFKNSRFLTKHDCDPPITVTIERILKENVAPDGMPETLKGVAYFSDHEKPWVVNWTNLQKIARLVGTTRTEDWRGIKVTLVHDPDVAFGSEIKGGIRVQSATRYVPEFDDNLSI